MPFFVFFVLFLRALRGKKNREQGESNYELRIINYELTQSDNSRVAERQTLYCHFEVAVRLRNLIVGATTGGCPYDSMSFFVIFLFFLRALRGKKNRV